MTYELVFAIPLVIVAFAAFVLSGVSAIAKRSGNFEKIDTTLERLMFMVLGCLGMGLMQLLLIMLINLASKF